MQVHCDASWLCEKFYLMVMESPGRALMFQLQFSLAEYWKGQPGLVMTPLDARRSSATSPQAGWRGGEGRQVLLALLQISPPITRASERTVGKSGHVDVVVPLRSSNASWEKHRQTITNGNTKKLI